MSELMSPASPNQTEHMSWVRTRMTLDREFVEWIRHGFALITVGFGSFAFLDGLRGGLGEGPAADITEPARIFSLIATVIGVLLIALALRHYRLMVEFVNRDEFGDHSTLSLPNENRDEQLALAAMAIGVISFIALVFLPG